MKAELKNTAEKRITWAWLFSEETLKALFEHVRNFLTGSFLLLLGLFVHGKEAHYIDSVNFAGSIFIVLACLLLLLNLVDGVKKLNRLRHHNVFIVSLVIIYVSLSIRLVMIAIDFRSALLN
jgi:hypothetical protein